MLQEVQYPGGKNGAGVSQFLINLMPPHKTYIEPFLGSGAVMRIKRPALVNIGVDRDARALSLVLATVEDPDSPSKLARRSSSSDVAGVDVVQPFATVERVGSCFLFWFGDALRFLRSYKWRGDELVYADPPYLLSSRSHLKEDLYTRGCEMSDMQHRDLLRLLRRLPCSVLISGYDSHLYRSMLAGWQVLGYTGATHRGPRQEWVWFNFPRPVAELHDYRFLGKTYRDRERFTRKKRRWLADLMRMPALERNALLAAIGDNAGIGGATRSQGGKGK